MAKPLTIAGLGGSLARASRSLAALRVALDGASGAGAATTLLDLRQLDLPLYNPDDEREPPPAESNLIEACYAADGMLWSSPMYRGTISGAFKNALDWLHALGSREPPFISRARRCGGVVSGAAPMSSNSTYATRWTRASVPMVPADPRRNA